MSDKDTYIQVIRCNLPFIQAHFGVTGMCLFGSVARGDNKPDSDLDILVDMPPKIFVMEALKNYLERILDVSVDLIRRHSHLSSNFISQISKDAIVIF